MSSLRDYKSIKNSKEFNYFYNNSKKYHTSWAIVFYKKTKKAQFGFTASKKVGNAVERNFAKRRLKALFLEYMSQLDGGTYIFVAKRDILKLDFSILRADFKKALDRLGVLNVKKSRS